MKVGDLLQSNTYSALLRTEEWESFSSSIRRARENVCECCRKTGIPTHVHHIWYEAGRKPWESDPGDMILLCHGCHKELHEQLRDFRRHVFRHLRPGHLEVLNRALEIGLKANDPLEFVHAISEMAKSPASIKRFAYAWNGGTEPQKRDAYNATERGYEEKH